MPPACRRFSTCAFILPVSFLCLQVSSFTCFPFPQVNITFIRGEGDLIAQLEDKIKDVFMFSSRSDFEYELKGDGNLSQSGMFSRFSCQRDIWALEGGDCLLVRSCTSDLSEGEEERTKKVLVPFLIIVDCHMLVSGVFFLSFLSLVRILAS